MNVYERIKLFIKLLFSNEKELYSFCADLTGFCPRGIAIYRQALTHRSANASAINGTVVGSSSGYSKREAHQHAAEAAMKNPKKPNKKEIGVRHIKATADKKASLGAAQQRIQNLS